MEEMKYNKIMLGALFNVHSIQKEIKKCEYRLIF